MRIMLMLMLMLMLTRDTNAAADADTDENYADVHWATVADADMVLMLMVHCPGEQENQEKPWKHHKTCQVSIAIISILHPHAIVPPLPSMAPPPASDCIICFSSILMI